MNILDQKQLAGGKGESLRTGREGVCLFCYMNQQRLVAVSGSDPPSMIVSLEFQARAREKLSDLLKLVGWAAVFRATERHKLPGNEQNLGEMMMKPELKSTSTSGEAK